MRMTEKILHAGSTAVPKDPEVQRHLTFKKEFKEGQCDWPVVSEAKGGSES